VEVTKIPLPGPARAAAAAGRRVWCSAGGRLVAFDAAGSLLAEAAEPGGLRALASGGSVVGAALQDGVVLWLDPADGTEQQRVPVGGDATVVAGGGAVWVVDRVSARAWHLGEPGVLGDPVTLPGFDGVASDGERIWWTTRDDTLLTDGERRVDLGVGPDERGGMTACSGAVWVSSPGGLVRVGAWAAERSPPLSAPEGPVPFLACADGALVGGSGRRGLFVLDPLVDADVRHLDVDLGGDLAFLVAAETMAWAIPAGIPEARLVAIRPQS
jgi:hypothetical protein